MMYDSLILETRNNYTNNNRVRNGGIYPIVHSYLIGFKGEVGGQKGGHLLASSKASLADLTCMAFSNEMKLLTRLLVRSL
jgi:hypothetical protein